jgi:hypothetical protein
MMQLPNGEFAEIQMEKLIGYCLNPNHSSGKHKAKVFAAVLDITAENAEVLLQLIQRAAIEGTVVQQNPTEFGILFKVDWVIPETNQVVLRTLWEIKSGNSYPRLVSAFIK